MTFDDIIIDPSVGEPDAQIIDEITQFRDDIITFESQNKLPFILFQDGKSEAYYLECHIQASDVIPLIDLDAVLDPEEQEQFRLQRELQPGHRSFLRMISDAKENRQFSDIIAEYTQSYRPEIPLKLLGGQHRTEAILRAYKDGTSRYHGFKIYFGLSVDQRNEIAQVANTNIAISVDLIDRMQETSRGPELRTFCHNSGLLEINEDFADRRRADGKITVRIARTFLVNYYEGKENADADTSKTLFIPYICRAGQQDEKYLLVIEDNSAWEDLELLEAARQFSRVHHKQMSVCANDPDLNTGVFRNKATSFSVLSSWAFIAGYLQTRPKQLSKLYSLVDKSGKRDPLAAKFMSESSHPKDPPLYRGLGVRYGEEDRGRVTELFLQYSEIDQSRINKSLIESAIMNYEAKVAHFEAEKSRRKLK